MQKAWWKEAVVYQIYPRSFMDSDGDGVGDIKGITSRLDYLKELGIDVIWLSPVYKSPNYDNGYDISDYQDIMDEFGTMEDFDEMLAQAHKRGIKIVMDLVVNHSSFEHKWFIESRKSKDNPYRDFYIWRDPKEDGSRPNNWGAWFGGPAWTLDEATGQYYLHLFTPQQPDLNWDNPKVRDAVFDMMNWWCEKGIDGFRMDVISLISKVPSLPDGPKAPGAIYGAHSEFTTHGPHVHDYLKEMNRKVLSKYDLLTVGETAGVTVEQAAKYANVDGSELSMVFQFEHVESDRKFGKWTDEPETVAFVRENLTKWQYDLEGKAWNSLYLANHDQPRSVSHFGNDSDEHRAPSAKMLATMIHMMQGTPYVYQGEELGMTNYPFTDVSEFRDIESINACHEWVDSGRATYEAFWPCLVFKSRDNARTPMQWDDSENAGFTTGKPWINVNPNYKTINAKAQMSDPNSVFSYYKKLIALRKQYDVVTYGRYQLIMEDDPQVYAYTRTLENERLLIVCNYSDKAATFTLPEEFEGAKCLIANFGREEITGTMTLKPYECFVLYRA